MVPQLQHGQIWGYQTQQKHNDNGPEKIELHINMLTTKAPIPGLIQTGPG